MFRFGHPEYLYLLLLIPALIFLFGLSQYYKKRALNKFGDLGVIEQLMPFVSKTKPVLKFIFLLVAII